MLHVAQDVTARYLRDEADRWIAADRPHAAFAGLAELWRREPGAGAASFVLSRYEQIRAALGLQPHRLAILRSFTVEPVVLLLRCAAFLAGLDLTVRLGDFNAYVQEIVDPGSALYSLQPDTVVLATDSRDACPRLVRDWSDLSPADIRDEAQAVVTRFAEWIGAFRRYSPANLVVHNLAFPQHPSRGVLDLQLEVSQAEVFQEINRGLRQVARQTGGVYVLDYDALVARHGRESWGDERKWLTIRLPFGAENLGYLAHEWMRFLHPLSGKIAKVVAVDLDNTLWGGVIGEDGLDGIKLGGEHPGAAYRDVQRALLDLRQRGILLAVCSKNNLADAMEVLQRHPEMLLKSDHFAAMRINWNDKAANLREIAAELNIGIDSVAFVDDNPVERQQVRWAVPEVKVIDLPDDPMEFAHAIRQAPVFERLAISSEDSERGDMYRAQQERQKLESSKASREDFLRSLQQQAEVGQISHATLARVAQLTQKTNQFNLTTRRYTEQQVAAMASSRDWRVYWIRVRDQFGDNGLVGVAIVRVADSFWEIDTLLISCRVIGRGVETAFLAYLIDQAQAAGVSGIQGWYFPTKKNLPAAEFYSSHGFCAAEENSQGTRWVLPFPQSAVRQPDWITITPGEEN